MCNLDKHRRIPIKSSDFFLNFPNTVPTPEGLAPETTNERIVITVPLIRKSEFQVYECQPITVKFGGDSSGISEAPEGITEIYDFIANDVIPRFERFFI